MNTKSNVKTSIIKTLHHLKNQNPISKITCNYEKLKYSLVPINQKSVDDKKTISLLSEWRVKHQEWFPAQFKVTDEGTKMWLQKQVIETPDRLLFMIQVGKKYIGHIGLYRFNFLHNSVEIDNIVRGENTYPGIMTHAIEMMIAWSRETLGIQIYTLQTHSDNKKALDLYERLGFVEMKRTPLIKQVSPDRTDWVEAPKDFTGKAKKYDVYMQLRSTKKISFAGPWITQKEIDYVNEAVTQGFYDNFNKHVQRLEKNIQSYLGVKYVIPTHCCTVALHLACATLGFQKGDEIICTDYSWVATANAIAYTGATPVFVDIDPDTWCIDPQAIEKAITKNTKGIMLVHTFGHPAPMDEILKIAKKHNLKVIEDAAPSLGAKYKGKKTGTFGDIACFSFQGGKIAVSGEGGVLVTNNKELFEKATLLSQMGRTDSQSPFWCDFLGFQYGMSNIASSLAAAQVERIEDLVKRKRKIFDWYYKRLKNIDGIKVIKEKEDCYSNYSYPSILLEKTTTEKRDKILSAFKALNIHARPGFPPMSQFPHFQKEFKSKLQFKNPVTHSVWKQGISLPSALNMEEEDVDFVCVSLLKLLET